MNFFINIYKQRVMLWNLIKSDFKNRYLGNHFGIVWAFIQPLIMVAIYWFVFTHGFKSTPVDNVPFLAWLLAGMVPWFLLNDAIMSSSRAIVDQSFLVKKIVFEVKLLPIVKIGSAFLVNIAFLGLLIICLFLYHFLPTIAWLQIFYYLFCVLALTLGSSLLLSALMPFMLDVGQFVSILMQVMFWATPIFWNKDILSHKYSFIVKLNPFAYIINGMRDALLFNQPFWIHYWQTLYFWGFVGLLLFIGNIVFTKLRPHFADVL
jgi:lipopolysaccharide transport system permease protein/teichoic acid transport system permease protein